MHHFSKLTLKHKEYYTDPFRGPHVKYVQRNHVSFWPLASTTPSALLNNRMTSLKQQEYNFNFATPYLHCVYSLLQIRERTKWVLIIVKPLNFKQI